VCSIKPSEERIQPWTHRLGKARSSNNIPMKAFTAWKKMAYARQDAK
jgi:hypothetical protein